MIVFALLVIMKKIFLYRPYKFDKFLIINNFDNMRNL